MKLPNEESVFRQSDIRNQTVICCRFVSIDILPMRRFHGRVTHCWLLHLPADAPLT